MNPTSNRFLSTYRRFTGYKQFILPALAACCFIACNTANGSIKDKGREEKIITIPVIKDTSSVNNKLRQTLPFRYNMNSNTVIEIRSNTTRLHLKGDSCWLEYISQVVVHSPQSNGTMKSVPMEVLETTDTLAVK